MPFPWSWRIDLVLFGRYKEVEKGDGEGSLLARTADFEWMQEEEMKSYEKVYALRAGGFKFHLCNEKKEKAYKLSAEEGEHN